MVICGAAWIHKLAADSRFVVVSKYYVKFQHLLLASVRIHWFATVNSGVGLRLQGIAKQKIR